MHYKNIMHRNSHMHRGWSYIKLSICDPPINHIPPYQKTQFLWVFVFFKVCVQNLGEIQSVSLSYGYVVKKYIFFSNCKTNFVHCKMIFRRNNPYKNWNAICAVLIYGWYLMSKYNIHDYKGRSVSQNDIKNKYVFLYE